MFETVFRCRNCKAAKRDLACFDVVADGVNAENKATAAIFREKKKTTTKMMNVDAFLSVPPV